MGNLDASNIPDRPGTWRAQYKEGFRRDFHVYMGKDAYGRDALLCLPGAYARQDQAPTVQNMTEVLGTFGAHWVGRVEEEPGIELPPPFTGGEASPDRL